MNTYPLPPHPAPALAPVELAQRLEGILASIAQLVFGRAFILGDLAARLHNHLGRARRRLATLLAILAAGRLPRQRAPRPRTAEDGRKAGPPSYKFPSRRAWFLTTFGQHAGGHASQLQFLLNDPATLALIASAPPEALKPLGRILRPLCRLLGADLPPKLRLPPREPKPAQPRPAQPSRPKPTPQPIYP